MLDSENKEIKHDTIKEYFEKACKKYEDRVAFVECKNNSTYSYKDIEKSVISATYSLKNIAKKNTKCTIISENSVNYMIAYFSIIFSSNIACMIAGDLDEETLNYQLDYVDTEVLFISKKYLKKLESIEKNCKKIKEIIIMSEKEDSNYIYMEELTNISEGNYKKALNDFADFIDDPKRVCQILFTSGTSGYNKAVMLKNENICCSVYAAL